MGKKGRKREHGVSVAINGGATHDMDCSTSLWHAADKGQTETCEMLLASGADVNRAKISNGMTPLFRAAANGHDDTCRLLLSQGAEMDHATHDGLTPVYVACQNNHRSTMKLLLEHGAKTYTHTWYYGAGTMLYIAAKRGDAEICHVLLQRGAYVNTGQDPGMTPLFVAASMGHTATCAMLLAHGARLDNEQQPIHVSAQNGHQETCLLLLGHCVGGLSTLVDKPNHHDMNPLTIATLYDRYHLCAEILEHGAESHFSLFSMWGETPLQAATNKGNPPMCKLLLMHGSGFASDATNTLNIAA